MAAAICRDLASQNKALILHPATTQGDLCLQIGERSEPGLDYTAVESVDLSPRMQTAIAEHLLELDGPEEAFFPAPSAFTDCGVRIRKGTRMATRNGEPYPVAVAWFSLGGRAQSLTSGVNEVLLCANDVEELTRILLGTNELKRRIDRIKAPSEELRFVSHALEKRIAPFLSCPPLMTPPTPDSVLEDVLDKITLLNRKVEALELHFNVTREILHGKWTQHDEHERMVALATSYEKCRMSLNGGAR